MKRNCLILFTVLFVIAISGRAGAQRLRGQARIDSLTTQLSKATADTHKIFLMSQISFEYGNRNPELGIKFGTEALELARKISWQRGIGNSLYYRGANFLYSGRYPEALDDYLGALRYFEQWGDSNKLAGTYSNIGGVYSYQGKDDVALEYFLKALKINRSMSPNSNFEAANLGNISIIYFNRDDYKKALEFSLQAVNICLKSNFMDMLPNTMVGTSAIYLELKQYPQAINYAGKALELARQTNDVGVLGNSYLDLGVAHIRLAVDSNRHVLDSMFHGNKQLAFHEARKNLDSALATIQLIEDPNQLSEIYKYLSQLEEYEGNYKKALLYHQQYKNFSDTIYNADNKERVLQTQMQYEFDKKEATTKAETDKREIRQKIIRNFILAGLVIAMLVAILFYFQRNTIAKERKRSEELLLNILPEEVAEELKSKGSAEAKHFDDVTVMFTDFKNFTQISETLTPAQLVTEIHNCFKAFDTIIEKYNIEKIKTIGDSYMCAGGLPVANKTNAIDVVNAAIEIQEFMQQHIQQRVGEGKEPFEIRIGVHTGPVVAGIVGVKKFAYDIWGDTVNIASRMESSGETGKVNISNSTYELVKDTFACTYRGKIQAKNKGEIDMYFVGKA